MKKLFSKIILFIFLISIFIFQNCSNISNTKKGQSTPTYSIVIHGGAGTLNQKEMSKEKEQEYRLALDSALTIGENALINGKSSLDAVELTICYLENNPLFNAGKGAVFSHAGKNELDASIMDGKNQMAGAVGGVTIVKNPIRLARAVMEKSKHVLLTGAGAEAFAKENNIEIVDPSYFFTERRWNDFLKVKQEEDSIQALISKNPDKKFGTVGCVALDQYGNLAAGTSTGGMTNKKWNRFGDTPIIGAGTYADNNSCAVSCTGHGEFFIRYAVAHDIAALVSYKHLSVEEAGNEVVMKKLVEKGGEGGCIILDKFGNIAMPFNSEGMYRGFAKPNERKVEIFKVNKQ